MYMKFRVEDRQCIWSFGSHWPIYIEFCWRPLSTLFLYVRCCKMAIALCSPDGKRHFFLRCNFFKLKLLIWPTAKSSLKVYEVWDFNLAPPFALGTLKDQRHSPQTLKRLHTCWNSWQFCQGRRFQFEQCGPNEWSGHGMSGTNPASWSNRGRWEQVFTKNLRSARVTRLGKQQTGTMRTT